MYIMCDYKVSLVMRLYHLLVMVNPSFGGFKRINNQIFHILNDKKGGVNKTSKKEKIKSAHYLDAHYESA
jgi:hypothetical protein